MVSVHGGIWVTVGDWNFHSEGGVARFLSIQGALVFHSYTQVHILCPKARLRGSLVVVMLLLGSSQWHVEAEPTAYKPMSRSLRFHDFGLR